MFTMFIVYIVITIFEPVDDIDSFIIKEFNHNERMTDFVCMDCAAYREKYRNYMTFYPYFINRIYSNKRMNDFVCMDEDSYYERYDDCLNFELTRL